MNEREKIVRYWHSIELLQPQAVPKEHMQRRANTEAYISSASTHDFTPPWFPGSELSRQSLPPRHEWSHTVYAYVYDSKEVSLVLKQKFGADLGYAEPQARDTAVFALQCDMSGRYVLDSLVLSSEAWFLGRIRTGQDYSDWPSNIQKEAESAAQRLLQEPVSRRMRCANCPKRSSRSWNSGSSLKNWHLSPPSDSDPNLSGSGSWNGRKHPSTAFCLMILPM